MTMKVGMSACLAGVNCKYNGKNNYDSDLMERFKNDEIILICPEMEGGLPCPRIPCEIKEGRVIDANGQDHTQAFEEGALHALDRIKDCDLLVLQPRSPSCGVHEIYDGSFTNKRVPGSGIFAQKAKKLKIPLMEASTKKTI
ncbi:DUF523 domain-containing protein [Dubosiella newyorkensis]|uniref:Uncharacterized protein n=4 Tax=Dubosiella newyorkensis TaxID=1862672 RepID=A0A1U7NLU3_9FIRM|nr:DUF523 domain-containing protein [Dubosiella newyorkensis]OLU45976.1 hypothetical protein BO225_07435 [Dubosiella newyorkensis]